MNLFTGYTLLILVVTWLGSFFSTRLLMGIARKYDILDAASSAKHRKLQKKPIPLLGGMGFVIVCTCTMACTWLAVKYNVFNTREFMLTNTDPFRLIWVILVMLGFSVMGFLDDIGKLGSKIHTIGICLLVLLTVFAGSIYIRALSFPFDTLLPQLPYLGHILSIVWIMACIAATKFLDGLDGLVGTIGIITLLTIASVTTLDNVTQPLIFLFSLTWVAGILGFLPWNFPHAKVYLGNAGSEIIGYIIGVLSIISGAKVATTGAVLGLFIADLLLVWLLRILDGRNPLTSADRNHWHHRLFDSGLSKIKVLAITALLIIINAILGVELNTSLKIGVIALQGIILCTFFIATYKHTHKKKSDSADS